MRCVRAWGIPPGGSSTSFLYAGRDQDLAQLDSRPRGTRGSFNPCGFGYIRDGNTGSWRRRQIGGSDTTAPVLCGGFVVATLGTLGGYLTLSVPDKFAAIARSGRFLQVGEKIFGSYIQGRLGSPRCIFWQWLWRHQLTHGSAGDPVKASLEH